MHQTKVSFLLKEEEEEEEEVEGVLRIVSMFCFLFFVTFAVFQLAGAKRTEGRRNVAGHVCVVHRVTSRISSPAPLYACSSTRITWASVSTSFTCSHTADSASVGWASVAAHTSNT